MELGELILNVIVNLISSVIDDRIRGLDYFQQRKVRRRVEDAVAEVVEPLLPFFDNERVPKDKQLRLVESCVSELQPLVENPERLFQGSLNGQKIFEEIYNERELPQTVVEDGLIEIYTLLYPRIATLLCKIPAAVKAWEAESWAENFRRFDEIADQLKNLFRKVDEIATSAEQETDALLTVVRKTVAQKIRFELDLTGLRGDIPKAGKFDDFFIHPAISEVKKDDGSENIVNEADASFALFTSRENRFTIIGQPGAGKSTWAKWLQREALSARWVGICVRVELRNVLVESLPSLHQLVRKEAGQHLAERLTADRVASWVKSNQLVFVFDGFDEIPPNNRDTIHSWIADLATAVESCPVIVTSRPLTTDHLQRFPSGWQTWNIEPFDNERINEYMQRWYNYAPLLSEGNRNVDVQTLSRQWLQDPTIGPLTGNPLLLSTLLMVHHLDGSLPSGRSQLYKRYVEGMLGLWDDRRDVTASDIQLTLKNKRGLIKGLALKMFMQQKDQLDENDAVNLMSGLLQSLNISVCAEDVLAMLRERSGLIIGPGIYNFVHKSVLEYLVAESVLQGDQRDDDDNRIDRFCLFENRRDDRWNTVTFLWAGLAPVADVELFVAQCIDVNHLSLAYGILLDQYDKFHPRIRKQYVKRLIAIDQTEIDYEFNRFWVFSHSIKYAGNEDILSIPAFNLRGLSSNYAASSVDFLLERVVSDRSLTWRDIDKEVGEARNVVWMACASTSRDFGEWKECITSPCPNEKDTELWMHWAVSSVLRKLISAGDILKIRQVVDFIESACTDFFYAHMPITLSSTILDLFIREEAVEKRSYEAIYEVLIAYTRSKMYMLSDELLLGTNMWMEIPPDDNECVDLLYSLNKELETFREKACLEDDSICQDAIELTNQLISRRDLIGFNENKV